MHNVPVAAWLPESLVASTVLIGYAGRAVRRVSKKITRIDGALPTLLAIADEFKHNGGSSLKDHIVAFDTTLVEHSRQDEVRFAKIEGILLGQSTTSQTSPSPVTVVNAAPTPQPAEAPAD